MHETAIIRTRRSVSLHREIAGRNRDAELHTVSATVGGDFSSELHSSISCPQFNGAGLNSVEIIFNGGISGSIQLENFSNSVETPDVTLESGFSIAAIPGFTADGPVRTAARSTGFVTIPPHSVETVSGLSGGCSDDLGTNSTMLASYLGVGTIFFEVDSSTDSPSYIGVIYYVGGNDSVSASAVVSYNFGPSSPTPEPASVVMLCFGLVSFYLVVRRNGSGFMASGGRDNRMGNDNEIASFAPFTVRPEKEQAL